MKLQILHKTTYVYETPVQYALQQVRLTPKNRQGQQTLDWQIDIEGGDIELEFEDHNNNRVQLVNHLPGSDKIEITARGIIETNNKTGITGQHGGFTPLWYFLRSTELTKPGKRVQNLVKSIDVSPEDKVPVLHHLSQTVLSKITYEIGQTEAGTTAEQALENGSGVCQDHAHVFIAAARMLGFPARYVSGYLMLNDTIEQDATHAWSEVHFDGLGWVGFDISNGISPDERYVPVATGLDYSQAAPITGMRFGNNTESMIVSLQVQQ